MLLLRFRPEFVRHALKTGALRILGYPGAPTVHILGLSSWQGPSSWSSVVDLQKEKELNLSVTRDVELYDGRMLKASFKTLLPKGSVLQKITCLCLPETAAFTWSIDRLKSQSANYYGSCSSYLVPPVRLLRLRVSATELQHVRSFRCFLRVW